LIVAALQEFGIEVGGYISIDTYKSAVLKMPCFGSHIINDIWGFQA
jgi:dihydropteroate synthase